MTLDEWLEIEPDPLAVIYGMKPMDPAITILPSKQDTPKPEAALVARIKRAASR
jgi:hypothetical protein